MSWHRGPLLAFDLETTGVDVETARIVTAAVLRVGMGRGVEADRWVVDPGVEIPAEAAAIHGFTTERARNEGVQPHLAVSEIVVALREAFESGTPVVIYNAPYDLTVLDREIRRHADQGGLVSLCGAPRPIVDPLCIDRALDRYRRGKRTLTAACEHYKVALDEAHAAHGDALAAARLAWRLATTYSDDCADVEVLHDRQVGWYREWAEHFAGYLRGQGKDASGVTVEWPWRPVPSEVAA